MRFSLRHFALPAASMLLLAGCANPSAENPSDQSSSAASSASASSTSASASPAASSSMPMEHKMDGGPAPAGMKPAKNAKYPVGTQVTLEADHMPDMKGATATVVGVYSTVTYSVTYTPTNGGAQVVNHKWVVQEELSDVGTKRVADGQQVTITADHMKGMKGAEGVVVSSTTEPVYIVDYTNSEGMTMKNHKWVVESEIKPAH